MIEDTTHHDIKIRKAIDRLEVTLIDMQMNYYGRIYCQVENQARVVRPDRVLPLLMTLVVCIVSRRPADSPTM